MVGFLVVIALACPVEAFGSILQPGGSPLSVSSPLYENGYVRQVRVLTAEHTGLTKPVGLSYWPARHRFYALSANGEDFGSSSLRALVGLTLEGDRASGPGPALPVGDPINVAFDGRYSRLLALGGPGGSLVEVRERDGATPARRDVAALAAEAPRGMAVDPVNGDVYFLDARGPRIVRVSPDSGGDLANAKISVISLTGPAATDVRGIAFDSSTGHLYVLAPLARRLFELTTEGTLVASRDLQGVTLRDPQAMVFAPSGDQTDDAREMSLYVADAGGATDGHIVELSLAAPAAPAAASFVSSLVRTTDMSKWSPPSPDPSGLTYLPATRTLLMVDGEVDETVGGITHFQGANVWEMTTAGSIVGTGNVSKVAPTSVPMTNEPTGVTFKPANGHYFITDDDGRRVFDLNPGSDGKVGTSGDTWTSFSTSGVGDGDPEGIAYDSQLDRLFVADGVNQEVYEYTASGAFVHQFDVAQYGVVDPESVEYDAETNTLLVLSNSKNRVIIETSTNGDLLRTLDVSASQAKAPAGLAVAPASDGSGQRRFYIVDRGIDNDSNPSIIDGRMYEMTAPGSSAPGNAPPVVSAGPDLAVTLPNSAGLNGTVTDDGLPNPPGQVTSQWSTVSGPGTVTFADASAPVTSATFSAPGSYVLRLTASDSQLTGSDEVAVAVSSADGSVTREVSVAAGSDDAEESSAGSVSLSSSDLELVTDGSTVQTVGIRFAGVAVPQGATVTSALIQFQTDETSSGTTALTVRGQLADNTTTFTTASRNVSSRPRTIAGVDWTPPPWTVVDERASAQQTPNLASVVQEIVSRSGWASGNALAFVITGTGQRTAEAFEGGPPPALRITYTTGGSPGS